MSGSPRGVVNAVDGAVCNIKPNMNEGDGKGKKKEEYSEWGMVVVIEN